MVNYKPQIGDIVLIDSDQTGARIVKFFMTAPTWYKHI
jgi:5S rRNA maturation endonuclease (ribonuclease M5)